MQRRHRDKDILWLTSGLSFLSWVSAFAPQESLAQRRPASRRSAATAPGPVFWVAAQTPLIGRRRRTRGGR